LGVAYANLRPPQFVQAEKCFVAALRVYTRERYPASWAQVQINQATTYVLAAKTEDTTAHLQKALNLYRSALQVVTEQNMPYRWARLQLSIGHALIVCPNRTGDSLREAIECLRAAGRILTETSTPQDWADLKLNFGLVYGIMKEGDSENYRRALEEFVAAQRIFTREKFPQGWALLEMLIGSAHFDLKEDRAANAECAKDHWNAALEVFNENEFPKEHRDIVQFLERAERRLLEASLPGTLFDEPEYAPLNRSGLMHINATQIEAAAAELGLKGKVEMLITSPTTYKFNYFFSDEDAQNPGLAKIKQMVDAVNSD
jgi:tetratricopeptide (TPR) repeat protein